MNNYQQKIDELQLQIEALKSQQKALKKQQIDERAAQLKKSIEPQKIVVVGGGGRLGRLFVSLFRANGHLVKVVEQDDWESIGDIMADAALAVVSVPINLTEAIVERLGPHIPSQCILADFTSTKSKPLTAMMDNHTGPVVGLHPMFGPDVTDLHEQVVVHCHGRDQAQYQWLLEEFKAQGAILHDISAESHDKAMAFIQVMRHFTSFVYGLHLSEEDPNLTELIAISSPIYRLELAMVGRLFAQNSQLYADIIFQDKDNFSLLNRYLERYKKGLDLLDKGCKDEFKREFANVTDWFGDFAEHFLQESREMLEAAHSTVSKV